MSLTRPDLFNDLVLSRGVRITLLIWGLVSLVAMLAYPFGYDQSAFVVGGEMIVKQSAIPYRDLIDTKPPLIFYLYGLASALFGHNQWGIRLFDIIWQCLTAVVLYRLIRDKVSSEALAYLAAFLYVWQYASTGYWMTAQAESFAILPMLLILEMVLSVDDHRAFRFGLATGMLLAVIFLLKFTLVLFFAGVIIYLLRYRFRGETIPYLLGATLTFALCIAGYLYHLHVVGGLDNFVAALRWVREYAAITPLFGSETIGLGYHKLFPEQMLRTFSITLTILGAIGMWRVFSKGSQSNPAYSLLALCMICALFGVLYERKFFPYHYTRGFVLFSPFVSVGAVVTYQWLTKRRLTMPTIAVSIAAVFFSPVMQAYTQTITWPLAVLSGKSREEIVQSKIKNYFAAEQRDVGEYLRARSSENDLFFWGNGVGVYYYANKLPQTFALTVTPFITDWTSSLWKDSLIQQLERSDPQYFVVERGDDREYISGEQQDSYEQLVEWPALHTYLTSQYTEDTSTAHFIVYSRSSGR